MSGSSYPGMTQPFSMSHSSGMSSVGVRQDSMGKHNKQTPCVSIKVAINIVEKRVVASEELHACFVS